ncbi:hypothetical protein [Pedococcus sp. 2YAF34]|uniref:hypothetical protein n=1 Tax=Pedococcus sp. 2YAF34 TaxID=3233032 RepID=UPI003F9E1C91
MHDGESGGIHGQTLWLPVVAGAAAFWLANLAISLTPVAADYRSVLSIDYVPMLVEAAVGGVVISSAVAFLLMRFGDHVPGRGELAKALVLSAGALALLTVIVGIPSVLGSGMAQRGHWFLVGLVINAIRIGALGVAVGYFIRSRMIRPNRALQRSTHRTPS